LYVLQSQGTEVVVPDVHLNAGDWVYFNGVYLGENEILTISTNSTLLPIIEVSIFFINSLIDLSD
jgi:hypothetical protein